MIRSDGEHPLRPQDLGIGRLFENVRDAVIVADAHDGRIYLWNPAAAETFGYSPSEALEMNVEALVPERLKDRHRTGLSRYRATGHGRYVDSHELLELPAVRKDGAEITVEMSLSPLESVRGSDRERRFVLAIVRDVTDRARTEAALRESEERYRLVAQATNEAIWDSDIPADRQRWNGAFETMFGYPLRQETDTAWWEDHIHPDDRERVLSIIADVLQSGGNMWSDEYRFRRADGSYATVVDRGYVVRDANGEAVRMVGSMMDVTERRKTEEALRASEAELRALFAAMTDVILVLDADGRYLKIAPTSPSLLYRPSEEMIGKTLHEVIPEEQAATFLGHIRRALESQEPVYTEYSLPIGGRETWFAGTVSPMGEDRVVFVARDITERKRAEEELRLLNEDLERRVEERTASLEAALAERERSEQALKLSEERYRTVIEQAGEGIFIFDAETKYILEANPAFQRLFGYDLQELIGMRVHDLVPDDPEGVDRNVARAVEQGYLLVGERNYRRKDGSTVEVEVSGSVISFGGRRVVCSVVRDVTERKRTEKALREVREAERARIARDLHDGALQDLTYALAEAQVIQILSKDPELDAKLEGAISALRRTERGLRGAVYDLRMEQARDRSFVRSVRSLADLNRQMNPDCEVALTVADDFPDELPDAVGSELLRVVQEALTNARRHSGARHVRVALDASDGDVRAEVADDGRGYDPDSVESGIGLKSMRERMTALGGEIEVQSQPGRGTRVRLRVPMAQRA
jgi:PAS domain S-box-containing protein